MKVEPPRHLHSKMVVWPLLTHGADLPKTQVLGRLQVFVKKEAEHANKDATISKPRDLAMKRYSLPYRS
jgi:hypothetical protein